MIKTDSCNGLPEERLVKVSVDGKTINLGTRTTHFP